MTSNLEENQPQRRIKVPQNKDEERELKAGLVEDDNEDIAYLNFRIIWPIGICTLISLLFIVLGIAFMEKINHYTDERFALNQIWLTYGKLRVLCADKFPYEPSMYPSFLRQVEIKVLTNIFFRIAVCVPMAVRIFLAMVVRNILRRNEKHDENRSTIYRFLNELSVVVATVEVLSQGLFSIVTIRFDFPEFYQYAFTLFVITSTVYMYMRTILLFALSHTDCEYPDTLSVLIKMVCTLIYSWTIPQLYTTHLQFILDPPCHGYVLKGQALIEYLALLSYLFFHLTHLIDIRDIRFLCYPRTCSGECEPLRPENFEPNQKYEFCRSYELRQRQLLRL